MQISRSGEVTLGPFTKGMNNRQPDYALPEGTARNIVNCDIDLTGKGRLRKGYTKVYSGMNTHDGYSCPLGEFFIENGIIKLFNSDNTATPLYSGVTGGTFCYENNIVYFSDGVVSLKISASGVSKWGIDVPEPPVLSATTGGYSGGVYQACCVFVDADGVESGNSELVSISAPNNSGIIFSHLPIAPTGMTVRLYLSAANGTEMYHLVDTILDSYTVTSGRYDNSNVFDNHFVSPAPAGRIIGFYNGRAYIAANQIVYYSEPFSYDHFKLSESYLLFPEDVDIMLPVTSGIFFCYGNKTDFYAGNPEDGFQVIPKFNYGGVYNTGRKIPNSDDVCWQSQRGMIIASADGQCRNIQEQNVATETAVSGATLIREKNGLRQFIAALQQPTTSPLAATSWIDAEIIRRG